MKQALLDELHTSCSLLAVPTELTAAFLPHVPHKYKGEELSVSICPVPMAELSSGGGGWCLATGVEAGLGSHQ